MPPRVRPLHWPADRAALLDHVRQANEPEEDDLLGAWYGAQPGFDPRDSFVIEDEAGALAAHAMIIPRQLQIGESTLPTAEIAVVGPVDSYAQHGLLRPLFETIHARMTERGDALGLLLDSPDIAEEWQYEYAVGLYLTSFESDIITPALLKAGQWDALHRYERRTADWLGVRHQPMTVRRFDSEALPDVAALYAAESARGHYLIARDEATWTWQLDYLGRLGRYEPDDFLVAESGGRVVAYARLVTQGPVNWFREGDAASFCVIEAAGDDPDGNAALLAAIGHTALTFGAQRVGLYVHPHSALMRHVLARGGCQRAFTGAGLVRLHHLDEALNRLHPTLEQRRLASPYAARAYRLVVRTENDQGEVVLGMGEPEWVELEAPSTVVVRLLTGWYGLAHLTTGYSERYAPLLRALFPPGAPKIALADML